jgi:hypothetical protein
MMLDELRRANPVPEPLAVEGAALYAQITTLPADPRLLRRSPLRRRGVVVAVAIAAAAIIASTAYGVSSWLGTSVKPPVTLREYHEAQSDLTLPPGYDWPTLHVDPNSVTSLGGGGAQAVMIALSDWECYWVSAIASGDVPAQQHAHAALDTLLRDNATIAPDGASENWSPPAQPHRPMVAFADDGGYQYKQRMYAEAADGKPQLLQQSCIANGVG